MHSNYNLTRFAAVCIGLTVVFPPVHHAIASTRDRVTYEGDMARIKGVIESLKKGATNDLRKYEKFASEILTRWRDRNKDSRARLALVLCEPLSAGRFNDPRQYQLAREIAIRELKDANQIPWIVEMELTNDVSTINPQLPPMNEKEFAKRRLEDVEVRLHALHRMESAIDHNWNPDEQLSIYPLPPRGVGVFSAGESPEAIKDPKLRAQYEAAIKENDRKLQRYSEQHALRTRLKSFQRQVKWYVVNAYSRPPFNPSELKQLLDQYEIDRATKEGILMAVAAHTESDRAKK